MTPGQKELTYLITLPNHFDRSFRREERFYVKLDRNQGWGGGRQIAAYK